MWHNLERILKAKFYTCSAFFKVEVLSSTGIFHMRFLYNFTRINYGDWKLIKVLIQHCNEFFFHFEVSMEGPIDQLQHERLSHEYYYPPFWWSKLPVVIGRHVLDNEAIDIEAQWGLILFSYAYCVHCFHTVLHFWPPVILTTKMAGNNIHEINVRTRDNWSIEGLVKVNSSCWLALVSIWVSSQYGVLNLEARICWCFLKKST